MPDLLDSREKLLARKVLPVSDVALRVLRGVTARDVFVVLATRERRWVRLRAYCEQAARRPGGGWNLPMDAGLVGLIAQAAVGDDDHSAAILRLATDVLPGGWA